MHRTALAMVASLLLGHATLAVASESTLPAWDGFAHSARHTAAAPASPQPLTRIRWTAPVDLAPVLTGGELLIHYGSPMITHANTVVVPTRISTTKGFKVAAYAGATGAQLWQLATDWTWPVYSTDRTPGGAENGQWTPPLPAVLTPGNGLAVAGGGGTVLLRADADTPAGTVKRLAFYGIVQWLTHKAAYDAAVQISTPLTVAADGTLYFGFNVLGATPAKLASGIARIDAAGHGSWVSTTTAAGDPTMTLVAANCAPALSPDGRTLYIAVTSGFAGTLVALDAATLAPRHAVALFDPATNLAADISADSSASPTVGPDGDVYYGVLESVFPQHNARGWLLHFDATLTTKKLPGSFGWDNTVSLVPASALPRYKGKSAYLLFSKYNNYLGYGTGDGRNRIAVLDPNASETDPYSSVTVKVMKEVETILSPEQFPGAPVGARYEWCINSGVVDAKTGSVMANSEDGKLYRWDVVHNTLAETLALNPPTPEAYTMTIIGPDGTVYAINDATLYAIGR